MALLDVHPLYEANKNKWKLGRDTCAGQDAVKAATIDYLPDFVPSQGQERYNAYLARAIYSNYTGRTKERLIGSIFRKPPEIDLPTQLEYMIEDCTGNGLSLEQFAKMVCQDIFETGRAGILVDYPLNENENPSIEQVKKLNLVPRLSIYKSESVYNWRSEWIDGKEFLTQVRIEEIAEKNIDEFTVEFEKQYRVLDLINGVYRQRLFDEKETLIYEIFPKANGKTLDYIPFFFIGVDNNASTVDIAPLYDLAIINIGHYRNSADYEEALHVHGQGTLFISSDLSTEQFKMANPNGIIVGSRAGHFLGPNGKAELIQMEANSAALEAMKAKEEQMSAFGANLYEFSGQNQTAEEARIKATSESSTLNVIVSNISEAIKNALITAAKFVGVEDYNIVFNLNTEFFPIEATMSDINGMVGLVEKGIIGLTDLRDKLRKTEVINPDRTDDDLDADADNMIRQEAQKDKEVNKNIAK